MNEIRKIYWMHFLAGLSNIAAVTFTLYFLSHGLQQVQIGQLFGFFMIALAIFDIPTGAVADIFGHKSSVAIGLYFQGLSFLLFFLFPQYWGFFVGMFASAVGLAFQSGATSSLIYELLKKENLHEDFQKVAGKAGGYFLVGSLIGSPIGAFIYTIYPRVPYLLAFFFFILAALSISFVKWEFTKKPATFLSYFITMGQGITLTLKNRILMATVLIGIGLTVNRLVFNQNISQPFMVSVGVGVVYIGVIAAIFSAVLALVSIHAYKVSQRWGKRWSLLLTIAVPSGALIALSFINTLVALPLMLLLLMGHTLRDPVMAHLSQEAVDPDKRSTMASTTSFLISVSAGILLPYWGKGIDIFGMHTTLLYLGMFSLVMGISGLLLFKSKKF